jgi:hypothetical protein
MIPNSTIARAPLNCERLETRENPDGNVSVAVFGPDVFVQGDFLSNHVRLIHDGFGNLFAFGINNTTVNGQGAIFIGTFIPRHVIMVGGAGNDTLEVFGLQAGGTLAIAPGDEFDRVDIGGVNVNVVDLDAGAGNDTVVLDNVIGRSFIRLEGGAGFDLLHIRNVFAPAASVSGFEQLF